VLAGRPEGAPLAEIVVDVVRLIGAAPPSSVRSYLRLNTPKALMGYSDCAWYFVSAI